MNTKIKNKVGSCIDLSHSFYFQEKLRLFAPMSELLQLDHSLFYLINQEWHLSFIDTIMPYWRDKKTWIPFYIAMTLFLLYRFRLKGLYLVLAIMLTAGVADSTSSHLIKKTVKRLRPCNDPELKTEVNLLAGCGSGYSFTSSHATNHFALAMFLVLTLGRLYAWIRWPLLLWAASIAYGQVYVGVHFPLDVLCGSILGIIIAILMSRLYYGWKNIVPSDLVRPVA